MIVLEYNFFHFEKLPVCVDEVPPLTSVFSLLQPNFSMVVNFSLLAVSNSSNLSII